MEEVEGTAAWKVDGIGGKQDREGARCVLIVEVRAWHEVDVAAA